MGYYNYKNILKYAEMNVRNGKRFSTVGMGFKVVKIIYWIATAYSAMMCISVMLGNLVLMGEYSAKTTTDMAAAYNEQRTYLITMIISVMIIVACLVFLKLRLGIPLIVTGCINCVIAFTVFYGISVTNDIVNGGMANFWGLFGVPSILCAALSVTIGVIIFTEKIRIRKEYDRLVTKLYASFRNDAEENAASVSFEEYINNYKGEEIFRNDIPLKKSLRRRKEKQDNENR